MSRQKQYEKVLADEAGDVEDVAEVDFSSAEDGMVAGRAMTASRFGKAFHRLSQEENSFDEMFDVVDDDRTEPTSNVHRHSFHSQHSDGKLTPATLPETPADGVEQAHIGSSAQSGDVIASSSLNPFSSFDLDDDELGDLQRYDFHSRESERLRSSSTGNEKRLSSSQWSSSEGSNFVASIVMSVYMLWDKLKMARLEARRRRAERLLAIPDDHYVERFCLFFSSWCDLTDRGMYLLITAVALWMVAVFSFGDMWWLWVGVIIITLRILLRPAYWYLWGRRVQQKRQATMALYDELNGGSPVAAGRVVIELPVPTSAGGEEDADNVTSSEEPRAGVGFPGDFALPTLASDFDGVDRFSNEFEPGFDDDIDINKSDHLKTQEEL